MELRQLQCMVVCAQTGSFSKAASILFTSQSNVSKTIASLEKELGRKLFERKQHGIELTDKGKQIYQYALSMIECSAKIQDCADGDDVKELRVAFQPSSWFASAFCEYYIREEEKGERYSMISAPVDEILRRIIANQDQLGFAYIEDSRLNRLKEMFPSNHIGYYVLKQTKTVLYQGAGAREDVHQEVSCEVIPLIQGYEDHYSGIGSWKEKAEGQEERRFKVRITTNSDYIMQTMLLNTSLYNISPDYLSNGEKAGVYSKHCVEEAQQDVQFVCLFRNDQKMEALPKKFLTFIRKYIKDEK